MKLRVLHVITGLTRGGAESMLVKVVTAMEPKAIEHRVICLGDEAPLAQDLRAQGVPTRCLGLNGKAHLLSGRSPFFQGEGAWRPQIVQGWMYHGNFAAYLVSRTFAPQSALVWNIRVGLDTMSTYRPFTRALIRFGANLSQAADRVIYNAISARDQHEAIGYCSERSQWIPNGFDLERFRPDPSARVEVRQELGLHQETPLLGHFARFHAEKNQRLFLSALEALAPDVHGLMAGQGIHAGEPELVEMIHQFGLENRVHLLGERTDLPRLTASLDIAVSPSWNEGFSNTLGEALACGVPCVATRVGDSETLVGMAGRIVPPGNIPAMVEALSLILALPLSQRANMGELGRQQMAVSYNLGAVAHQYQTLYETLAL